MPAIGSSDIAFTTQLEQLVARIQATKPASEALIHDLDQFIQKNLVVNQTPTEKPNPTAQDKSAVRVATAVLSMVGRCCEADKDEALVDLIQGYWPVIWRWLQFLERVFSQLDYGVEVKFKSICVIATTFECLTVQDALKTHIRTTPEAVSLIVGHWKRQGRDHKVDSLFNAFSMPKPFTPVLSSLLGNCPPEIGICDMVADTCGGPKSFAVIAMEHWAAALQDHGDHSFANLKAHLILIHNLMFPHPRQLIHYALLNQGMVPALVKSLVWLAGFSDTDSKAGYCVWRCCHLLQTAFVVPNEECWVSQALDAGLVSAYLRSSSLMMALPDYVRDECTLLFSRILCRSLIYLQVLKAAEKAIRRVDRLHLDHYSRQAAPVWASWTAFRDIATERMALKRAVDELDEQMPQAKQCRRVLVSRSSWLRLVYIHGARLTFCSATVLIKKTDSCAVVAVFLRHTAAEFAKRWTGLHIRPPVRRNKSCSAVRAMYMSQYSRFS